MHLANALGVPLIALFGPTNPLRTGPIFQHRPAFYNPRGARRPAEVHSSILTRPPSSSRSGR
jgi:ADP-heptose:LPS heptosyltransferase